jgi:hypothetical protein
VLGLEPGVFFAVGWVANVGSLPISGLISTSFEPTPSGTLVSVEASLSGPSVLGWVFAWLSIGPLKKLQFQDLSVLKQLAESASEPTPGAHDVGDIIGRDGTH